uniref:Ketimine reductase mu-crystallin n=1 Tax=Myripristis murdjan TaxID=586833 RepID=A0A668A482_9TELE
MAAAPVVISQDEVRSLLRYRDLIPRLEDALAKFSRRDSADVIQPVRSTVPLRKHDGYFGLMPTYMENDGVLCTKVLCFYKRQAGSALPSVQSTVLILDPEYGNVQAVSTAALLMPARAEVLAILGSGHQARSHYSVFTEIFTFKEVRVWSQTRASAERFSDWAGGAVRVCGSAEEAVRGADVIVTVTRATEPVLLGQWIKPGAHVAAVGACRPDWRELDDALMKEAVVYADSKEGAKAESGDIILSGAEVFAELGDILNGTSPAHREKTTVFKSLGMGLEDAVSAKLVFDRWRAKNSQT